MNELTRFDKLTVEMDEFEKANANLVFHIESKQGEKDARSHVAKLRKIKTAISNVHKEAKADILQAGRTLDAKKNELTGRVEGWIELQDKPLREKKDREVHEAFLKAEEIRIAREAEETERQAELERREKEVAAKELALKVEADEAKDKELAALREKVATFEPAETRALVEQKIITPEEDNAAWGAEEAARTSEPGHRDKIQSEAIESLTEIVDDIDLASAIVKAIDEGTIPNVKLIY